MLFGDDECGKYVIQSTEVHDGDVDALFKKCAEACALGHYCIVMHRADR